MIRDFIRKKERKPHLNFPMENGHYIFPPEYLEHEYLADLFANEKYREPRNDSMPNWVVYNTGEFQGIQDRGLRKGHKILLYYAGNLTEF